MNWNDYLQKEENIVWQGKPAPRCYTFRNWAHSLFGLVLLLSCFVWFYVGINLGSEYQRFFMVGSPSLFSLPVFT